MATNDDPLNALVITAMMQAIDEKKRDELIRKALEALITPSTVGYGARATSPLQTAFDAAVYQVALEITKEMVRTDEIRDKIKTLVAKVFEKIALDEKEISERMASALLAALTKNNY